MRKLSAVLLVVAAVATTASAGEMPRPDETVKPRAAACEHAYGGGYAHHGALKIWRGESVSASCISGGGAIPETQLRRLIEAHESAWLAEFVSRTEINQRPTGKPYCKLFAASDLKKVVRKVLSEIDSQSHPDHVFYVDEIDGGASFFLECFAPGGPELRLMPASPGDL